MRQRLHILISAFLFLSLVLTVIIFSACGSSDDPTPADPLTQAVKAMEENPRFSIQIGTIGPQGEAVFQKSEAEIWFVLPDKFYWHEEGVYEHYAYNISIGNDGYVSDDAVYWEGGSGGFFDYEELNPYYLVKHAINPIEIQKETIDGKEYRVFQAELDIPGWKTYCLPGSYAAIDMKCLTDSGKLDKASIESLGYEFLRDDDPFLSVISKNATIEVNTITGNFQAYVNNTASLTPEIKDELTRLIEAFGMKSCDFNNVEINVFGGEESLYLMHGATSVELKIYIEDGSSLPYLIKAEYRYGSSLGVEKNTLAIGIDYDESISITRPEKVIDQRKVEIISSKIQNCAHELQNILFDYEDANGVFPNKLDPESVSDILTAKSLKWPVNIFTELPIVQKKDSPGDYYYEAINDGNFFKLFIYGYFGQPEKFGAETEEERASIKRRKALEETVPSVPEVFTQEDFNQLTPSQVLPILTESERSQAEAIALNDANVQAKLQDTDYTISNVYPLSSATSGKSARVVILYFIHPYKIDFGGLSISVDLTNGNVTNVTQVPESICRWLKDQLFYKRVASLSFTDEQKQVIDFTLADPRVQSLVEGIEYVFSDVQTYNVNNVEGVWYVSISFFGTHEVADFSFPEGVSLRVDLKNKTVTLDPITAMTSVPQTNPGTTLLDLTPDQINLALELTLDDPRIKELLEGKQFDIWHIGGWYESTGLVGAAPEICLREPAIIEYDWPAIKYNKDGTFTVYTYHSSEKVTRLYIRVEFASQKVVEILPMYFP